MGTTYLNRLSGETSPRPEDRLLPGQYLILTDVPCVHNSVAASAGEFVVPDQAGQWSIEAEAGASKTGEFWEAATLHPHEQDSLRELGWRLGQLIEGGASWGQWREISPLAPRLAEEMKLNRLERDLQTYLWHLQEVCRNPRTHLRHETERLPISRARRIPTQAIDYLSSHTEDWQHRTLTTVIPHHILAMIPEDDYNLYENRVAARLVDHLHNYLWGRLNKLTKIRGLWEEVWESPDSTHWRGNRVFELLGKAMLDEGEDTAEKTREVVASLYYQVLGLYDSLLYRRIPHQAQVPPTLKATNIFINDRHYRFVSSLWQSWLKYGYRRPLSAQEFYIEQQSVCTGFDRFCALLVCRALQQLGYQTDTRSPFTPGNNPLELFTENGKQALLNWNKHGALTVSSNGVERVVFTPLASALGGGETAAEARWALDTVLQQVKAQPDSLSPDVYLQEPLRVILYSRAAIAQPTVVESHTLRLDSIGNDLEQPSLIGFCPVSTYSIGSVERVARALRWGLLGTEILSYPPTVHAPLQKAHHIAGQSSWMRQADKANHYCVCCPPSDDEAGDFKQRVNEAKKTTGSTKASRRLVSKLDDFDREVQGAISTLRNLLSCPVCGQSTEIMQGQERDSDRLICSCSHCQSRWGVHTCGSCGQDFPFIEVHQVSNARLEVGAGWVNELLGMDVLASPCWRPGRHGHYICPWCGTCRNSGDPGEPRCGRCHADAQAAIAISGEV